MTAAGKLSPEQYAQRSNATVYRGPGALPQVGCMSGDRVLYMTPLAIALSVALSDICMAYRRAHA